MDPIMVMMAVQTIAALWMLHLARRKEARDKRLGR